MYVALTGCSERVDSAVAFDGDYLAKNALGGCVIFLAGIGAGHEVASSFIGPSDAVHSEAVFPTRQGHIAATQFFLFDRGDGHRIFIKNIGAHAETVRAE